VRIKTYRLEDGERKSKEEFEALIVNNLDQVERISSS